MHLQHGLTVSSTLFDGQQSIMMRRVLPKRLAEAEELLEEIGSWSEEEIEELPELYRDRAREFRRLANSGLE